MLDRDDQIVAGVCYRQPEPTIAHLQAIVRVPSLDSRAQRCPAEDFCSRIATRGLRMVTSHFAARACFGAHGLRVDRRWGRLVRSLQG